MNGNNRINSATLGSKDPQLNLNKKSYQRQNGSSNNNNKKTITQTLADTDTFKLVMVGVKLFFSRNRVNCKGMLKIPDVGRSFQISGVDKRAYLRAT